MGLQMYSCCGGGSHSSQLHRCMKESVELLKKCMWFCHDMTSTVAESLI